MAGEIVLPFKCEPSKVQNPRCVREQFVGANGIVAIPVWSFKSGETADLVVFLPAIPPEIHASTPAASIDIEWATLLTDTTNAVKWYVKLYSLIWDNASYTLDPSAADFTAGLDSSVTDISLGASKPNRCSLAIPNAMAVAGRGLLGLIRRNDNDAADTLAGTVGVITPLFVATKA